MKASKLRQRLVIQNFTTTRSPTGAIKKEWVNLYSVYCSFEPLSVKDVIAANTTNSKVTARAIIRYREGITSAMQVIYKGKTYLIEGNPLEDKDSGIEYLTLMLSITE